jgi:outer membrane exchange protein TraA
VHPLLSLNARRALTLVLLALSSLAWAAKLPDVVVTGEPVAPSPTQPGTGLCVANSVSTDPAADFPQSTSSYIGGMNDFMERTAASRTTYVLRTPFDLSNNSTTGTQVSRGDFVDAFQGCASYGCSFFVNDPFTSFGSRFRGYLNVTPDMVNKLLHFGFYTDDAVSFVIFDRSNVQYQVINRPPQLGFATWRTTNAVTFQRPGLYPIEILYAEITDHAALEFALLDGTFADFERGASQTPIVRLNDSGFLLLPRERFFQTETGRPSFPDDPGTPQDELSQCQQCNRANANAPGNGGCGLNSGYHCNGAALCAPCDTARVCGPSCLPCGASTPYCINSNGSFTCVECTADAQCFNGRCDPVTNTCTGCNDNGDCPSDRVCNLPTATCVECNADSQCSNGRVCDLSTFTCVQCNTDGQCPDGRCDLATHTCTGCNADSQCSNGRVCYVSSGTCVECTANNHCPNGRVCNPSTLACVECTANNHCPSGKVCNPSTLTCVECTTNGQCPNGRVCNLSSLSCVECTSDSQCSNSEVCDLSTFTCVQCNTDSQCPDGRCDPATHACTGCNANSQCSNGKVCHVPTGICVECNANSQCANGKVCNVPTFTCVECNANNQCPNGKVCNLPTFTCVECTRNEECSPTQVCNLELKQCRACTPADGCTDDEPEPNPPGGGCGCGASDSASHALFSALLAALFFFRLLRPRRPSWS